MSLYGELAQLGEHLPCTQGVKGSIPLFSTIAINLHAYVVYLMIVRTLKTEENLCKAKKIENESSIRS